MFFNGMDRRTVYIILGVLTVLMLVSTGSLNIVLLTLPGVILAMSFHEFAHAWMADRLGDTTPRAQGRLTLNPAAHIDPVGLVMLIFVHIGWGKPVEINPRNFNSNKSIRTCEALVSLAGPVMNFILAFLLMIITTALGLWIDLPLKIFQMLIYAISVNIGLGVFNLIPIPPLDGSKIFASFLPYKVTSWLDKNMNYIYLIFMVLWISGMLGILADPVITVVSNGLSWIVLKLFGLFI